MPAIGEANKPVEQMISTDMHSNLTINHIYSSQNYPCIMDDNNIGNSSAIYCHCDAYNSEFHMSSN